MVVFVSGACALTESRPVRAVYARDLPPCFFRVCLLSLRVHPSGPFTSFRRFARVSASHALSRAPLRRFASPSPPSLQSVEYTVRPAVPLTHDATQLAHVTRRSGYIVHTIQAVAYRHSSQSKRGHSTHVLD